jgi:hypothetical protein
MTRRQFGALLAAAPAGQALPPRLRRADSYFGLHFDLHPGPSDPALGRDVTEEMVESILQRVKPDYIQYDAKGHVGWLGWPSKVSDPAPHIVNDSLAVYRKVTARNGVSLFIHFSGVWDAKAVTDHPDWARIDADGKPDSRLTSTFGPYVDLRMIPQLEEAASNYDLDGAWVDGECWAVTPDYCEAARAGFLPKAGLAALPRRPEDPGWDEFLEFNREQFRRYVRHYVDALHRSHPRFQVASNWLYSTLVPERPSLPVDFISGDYLGNGAISTARLESRYLAQTGMPWDLMAWGFQQAGTNSVGHVHKPALQLQQEAAVVLAQGGGFQVYYQPSRAGHFEDSHVRTMARVAEFCRARQKVCHKSEPVPQIGVIFSKETLYRTSNRMFGGWGKQVDPARGWIDALLECQYSVDVLPDWKASPDLLAQYPLIVLPEWTSIGGELKSHLMAYVDGGGRLVFSGAANMALLAEKMNVGLSGKPSEQPAFVGGGEVLANCKGVWQDVEARSAQVLATRHPDHDSRSDGKPAAIAVGNMVAIPGPLGRIFAETHAPAVRTLVRRVISGRFRPLVAVEAPPTVEVALRRKAGNLMIHLLNASSMQVAGDYSAIDYVPPVGPLTLTFNPALAPIRATLQPHGTPLPIGAGGRIRIDRVDLYGVVAVETRSRSISEPAIK